MRYVLFWIPVLAFQVAALVVADTARFRRRGVRVCGRLPAALAFALLVTGYLVLALERVPLGSAQEAAVLGLAWAGVTLATDLAVAGTLLRWEWPAALAPYDLRRGQYWAIALLWVAIAPWVLHRTGLVG